ncbi:391_t:CDS:2, partial [Funneliformis geosporum]
QNKKKAEIKAKNLAVEKSRETLKTEIAQLNKQEKELKEQFANCQSLCEKKLSKEKLTSLQKTLFDKKERLKNLAPASAASTLKDKKNLDKKQLANSLKKELKQQLEELENGTGEEDDIDIQNNPLFKYYFARRYLEKKDCQEIEVLIGQVQKLQKEKKEQASLETEQKLVNNPKLFEYYLGMSTERNGGWQSYRSFYRKHKGTNAEIGNFYLIEGIEEPTEFKY